jgi:hypothetical protein
MTVVQASKFAVRWMKENGFAFPDFSCDLVDRLLSETIQSTKSHEAARKDLL